MTITQKLLIGLLLVSQTQTQAQTKSKANIQHVTVFLNGAEIESSAKVNLAAGESEVIFTGVAGNIVQQSISIGTSNGVIVQSATAKNDYLETVVLSPKAQGIKDSLDLLKDYKQSLSDKKSVLEEQLAVIKENRKVTGTQSGLSVIELQKLLDLIGAKMNGILAASQQLDKQITRANERLQQLQQQLDEERKKEYQPGGQLLVKFYCTAATNTSVNISYVSPNASWTPSYDLRVAKINSPVQLMFKANIVQNTGVLWDNTSISLSTGNPNEGVEAPSMNPWYLSFYQAMPRAAYMNKSVLSNAAAPQMEDMAASYDTKKETLAVGSIGNYVQVDNSGINTIFDIALRYNIPSDGQEHLVSVKDYELPATYRYFVAPKLDRDAFLQARITNWEDLNLMPATTNIFYEGTYVGQGYIDMRNVKDTLNLSLGRDKKIIVRRENDKNYRLVRTIGTNIKRSYGYTIEVRNTKKEAIDLIVLEQFPISNDKDISVDNKEAEGATIDETSGAVQWDLSLKGNESKTLKLNYSVKYPKDKNIGNL